MKTGIVQNNSLADGRKITGTIKNFFKNISPFNSREDMPKALLLIKTFLAFELCRWVGLLLAEGIVIGAHLICGKNVLKGEMFDFTTGVLIQYFGYIIPIFVTMLYWKLFKKKMLSELGVTKKVGSWFVGAAAGVIVLGVCAAAVIATGTIRVNGFFADPDILVIVLMFFGFVIQGAFEEFLCRGLVMCSLKGKVSLPVVFAANAFMFALPHFSTLFESEPEYIVTGILALVAISCVFSFITLRAENIWAACGFHTLWNFCLESIMGLNLSGIESGKTAALIDMSTVGENLLNGGKYGIESSVITVVILTAASIALFFVYKKKTQKN